MSRIDAGLAFLARRRRLAAPLLLLAAALILMAPQSPPIQDVPGLDSGVYSYVGWRLLDGELPYRDVWDHKPPGIYFVNALGLWLAGGSTWGIWLVQLGLLGAAALVGQSALQRAFGAGAALAAGIAWLMALVLLGSSNRPETMALLLQMAAIALWLGGMADGRYRRRPFGLGLTAALALLLKPNLLAIWLAILVYIILKEARRSRWRRLAVVLGGFALGAALPLAAVLAYLGLNGALLPAADALFRFNLVYAGQPLLVRLLVLYRGLELTAQTGLAFTGLAGFLAGLLSLAGREPWATPAARQMVTLALIAWPLELLFVALPGQMFDHYYIAWLPVLAILTGYFFQTLGAALRRAYPKGGRRMAAIWTTAVLAAMITLPLIRSANRLDPLYNRQPELTATVRAAAQLVRQTTAPDDGLLVWGGGTRLNFMTRRAAPVRFTYQYPLYTPGYQRPELVAELAAQLAARPPAVIIDNWTGGDRWPASFSARQRAFWAESPIPGWQPPPDIDIIYRFVDEHYRFDGTVGPERWAVYRYDGR